jgi:hypothetical protein
MYFLADDGRMLAYEQFDTFEIASLRRTTLNEFRGRASRDTPLERAGMSARRCNVKRAGAGRSAPSR